MDDTLGHIWSSFFAQRTKPLQFRFNGIYRAVVVETNDPLRIRRVRFKIPELHDWDIKPEDCPWAVPCADFGMKRAGKFSYPCIGDYIWISFEKNHPYGPIYLGFATPTRRKFYPLPSIYGATQTPVDEKSDVAAPPSDYNSDYMPKDERPMSYGYQDRYGNLDITDATGFFPIEHAVPVPPADADPITKSNFKQSQQSPEMNNPDSKMMCRMTKYGMVSLQSDMGYIWQRRGAQLDTEAGGIERDRIDRARPPAVNTNGEFTGDFDEDEEFEIIRWKYMQQLLHENKPTGQDQRRIMHLTRYGHKFEMRDVGWNETRKGEFDPDIVRTIGNGSDQRWIKMRTKGGHIIELCDIGFDPAEDEYVKQLLLEDAKQQPFMDKEDTFGNDARFIRFVTRSGIKIALDDRTSDDKFASNEDLANDKIGTGVLIKGRATPGTIVDPYSDQKENPIGYYWQFDERPEINSTDWGTPMGQVIEMNDNEEFLVMCSRLPDLPTPWENLGNNEFLISTAQELDPVHNTHHLVIDHASEAIRLKSRAGTGDASRIKRLGDAAEGEHAGLEIHDAPEDDPWTEIVDIDKRGIWFSRKDSVSILRGKEGTNIYLWLDDSNNNIVLHNANNGKVQIYCKGNVEVISDRVIGMKANQIEMRAAGQIRFDAAGTVYTFGAGRLSTNADIHAQKVFAYFPTADKPLHTNGKGTGEASGGGEPVSNLNIESVPSRTQPDNRL